MKKEYVASLLFKNNRVADDLITQEELNDSDQQQSTEAHINSGGNNETVESNANSNQSSLPQRLLSVLQKASAALGRDRNN